MCQGTVDAIPECTAEPIVHLTQPLLVHLRLEGDARIWVFYAEIMHAFGLRTKCVYYFYDINII